MISITELQSSKNYKMYVQENDIIIIRSPLIHNENNILYSLLWVKKYNSIFEVR